MSKIYDQVNADLKTAMLNKDQVRVMTLRSMRAAFDLSQNEKNAKVFDDAKAIQVLGKLKSQRVEAASLYAKGNRPELVAKEEAEAVIISEYLPAEATLTQISDFIFQALHEVEHSIGPVINTVKAKLIEVNLTYDGGKLSGLVRTTLDQLK